MFLFWNRFEDEATNLHIEHRQRQEYINSEVKCKLDLLHEGVLNSGVVSKNDLHELLHQDKRHNTTGGQNNLWHVMIVVAFILIATPMFLETLSFLFAVRCFVPNNYLVWEATRPISDCEFCRQVKGPLILRNITRNEFEPYAYSSVPIIVKGACLHWPAMHILNFSYLKSLYEQVPGALEQACHFLPMQTQFKTLLDVFETPVISNTSTWYVGWSNCHFEILQKLRKLYSRPHFLPADAETSSNDYFFMGYERGIVMQLNYLNRLSWQAQLKGNKSWIVAPAAECDDICPSFSFYVEPGDTVLVDTRLWYHSTSVPDGQFSLSIQSEYG